MIANETIFKLENNSFICILFIRGTYGKTALATSQSVLVLSNTASLNSPTCAVSRAAARTLSRASPTLAALGVTLESDATRAAGVAINLPLVPNCSCFRWTLRGGFTIESTKANWVLRTGASLIF